MTSGPLRLLFVLYTEQLLGQLAVVTTYAADVNISLECGGVAQSQLAGKCSALRVIIGGYKQCCLLLPGPQSHKLTTSCSQIAAVVCLNELEIKDGCCSANCADSLKKEGVRVKSS